MRRHASSYLLTTASSTVTARNLSGNTSKGCASKHLEITTDTDAESFLGVTFTYDEEGNYKLGQKKLLTKLFNENPSMTTGKRWRPPTHPYGPAPTHGEELTDRGE